VGLSLRTQRLKLTWLLAPPFLWLARPSPGLLLAGLLLILTGLLLRALAAGHIDKDRSLATAGPYGYVRHPLYVGSLLVGGGLVVAGGRWVLLPLFLALFLLIYGRSVRAEEEELAARFGPEYDSYRAGVSAFLPRIHGSGRWDFRFPLFMQNKEWEAELGALAGMGMLWVKLVLA